jgi:hypothetical protein
MGRKIEKSLASNIQNSSKLFSFGLLELNPTSSADVWKHEHIGGNIYELSQ